MRVRVKLYRANLNKVLSERFDKTYMKYEKQLRLLTAKEIGIRQGRCEELKETVDMITKELIEKQKSKPITIQKIVRKKVNKMFDLCEAIKEFNERMDEIIRKYDEIKY